MNQLEIKTDASVDSVFDTYPAAVRKKLLVLRSLIIEAAQEIEGVRGIEETLKWGEPSYIVKKGSTLRIDWKKKQPDQYAMYFKCTSKLVPTFKIVYPKLFQFEGNRAIVFQMNDKIPVTELKKCITVCLTYHKAKQLPLLGL